jgi:hypothetical protein
LNRLWALGLHSSSKITGAIVQHFAGNKNAVP